MQRTFRILAPLLLACAPASAEPQERVPPPPPIPAPLEVRVGTGGTIEIPVRASTSKETQIEFIIRRPPSHGEIGALKRTGPASAVLEYRHTGEARDREDFFLYSARFSRGAISAPVRVTIRIAEAAPDFVTEPDRLDFGKQFPGDTTSKDLKLANRGGGIIEGTLVAPEGWSFAPDEPYRIGPGESTTYRIAFSANAVRQYDGWLAFSHVGAKAVGLNAEVMPSISASPALIQTDDRKRPVPLTVTNLRDRPTTVKITAAEGMGLPASVNLAGGERAVFEVAFPDADPRRWSGEIKLADGASTVVLPVVFEPLPGRLGSLASAEVDLGRFPVGTSIPVPLELPNSGGMPLKVSIALHSDHSEPQQEVRLTIPAASATRPSLKIQAKRPGPFRGEVRLNTENGTQVVSLSGIALTRTELARSSSPTQTPMQGKTRGVAPESSSTPTQSVSWSEPPTPSGSESSQSTSQVAVLAPLRLVEQGEKYLVIEWPAQVPLAKPGQLEARNLAFENDVLVERWIPVAMEGRREGGRFRLRLDDLPPGSSVTLRPALETHPANLRVSPQTFRTAIAPTSSVSPITWLLLVLGAALALLVGLRIRAARRS